MPGDDPVGHDPLLGHVLVPVRRRASRRRQRHARDREPGLPELRRRARRRSPGGRARGTRSRSPASGHASPRASDRTRSTPSTTATLELIAELSANRDTPVQIHLSETEDEVATAGREHGCRPAEYLDRLGLLTDRTVLAHGVWLDDAELALVAERGATIVTNPASNMKLAVGRAFPYPAARAAGIPIGLGTDGAASNNSLDLLAELKILALLQKHTHGDAAVLPAAERGHRHRRDGTAARRDAGRGRSAGGLRARRRAGRRDGSRAPHRQPRVLRHRRGRADRRDRWHCRHAGPNNRWRGPRCSARASEAARRVRGN